MRLDAALVERGLVSGRDAAKAAIKSGAVYVDGKPADKPSAAVAPSALIEVRAETQKYVSRGGLKLEHALRAFAVSPQNRVCLDCGASTGGFTDCLLQHGAAKVYAVDVGTNQLSEILRNDTRVVNIEKTNARDITPELFSEAPDFATIDVSFISLSLVLPAIRAVIAAGGEVICLVKPQFEAGRENVGKRGVVKDAKTHIAVLEAFTAAARSLGFAVVALTHSPLRGPEGNIEFLAHLTHGGADAKLDIRRVVDTAHKELQL
ncbi:MAG: TlyA family RNA methyltransferase [Oscillospiraceae bacterium]|jgi:23S rRNA (cytidine1920-2'-O)/16S rRNA (cytidine1409-2'-O)-methyltransferase|nr:TlyA family RNA methyltransferase [Oscillospiraceae bacterium]